MAISCLGWAMRETGSLVRNNQYTARRLGLFPAYDAGGASNDDHGDVAERTERRIVRMVETTMRKNNERLLSGWVAALALSLLTGAAVAKQPAAGAWVKHENLAPVLGADGKQHAATCSGYPGTDPKFSFWTKKGKSKNVAVFFEGGGACWDNLTCTFPIDARIGGINTQLPPASQIPQFFVPAIDASTNPATYDGIFNADNPANPVKDWSIVYIPYCTGDLHTGSTKKQYFNARGAVLPPGFPIALPELNPAFTLEHRGFDNFMVVLDWMKKNVDKPKNVLVTGSSAGGYGATANFPWIERTFRNAHTYVIADASVGITAPTFDQSTPANGIPGRGSWNMQLAPWAFGTNPSSIAGPDLLRTAAQALPHVKTAQFTTAFDDVQILFYGVMKQLYQYPGTCFNPANRASVAIDWHNQMASTMLSYGAGVRNFRYYVAQGTYHTLLRGPQFYLEDTAGVHFSEWVDDMLRNRGGTHGHYGFDGRDDDDEHRSGHGSRGGEWANVACPTCLVQLTCP